MTALAPPTPAVGRIVQLLYGTAAAVSCSSARQPRCTLLKVKRPLEVSYETPLQPREQKKYRLVGQHTFAVGNTSCSG
jgi:hypothetical protein